MLPSEPYSYSDRWPLFPTLQWRHDECESVSNRLCPDCLLKRLFRHRSKKTPKLRVTGLCEGNPSVTGGFPSQRSSNAENVSIWWRHHVTEEVNWRLARRPLVFNGCLANPGLTPLNKRGHRSMPLCEAMPFRLILNTFENHDGTGLVPSVAPARSTIAVALQQVYS